MKFINLVINELVKILKRKSTDKPFQWRNLFIWLIGFIMYRILMRIDIVCGNTLPDMLLTIALCLIAAKIVKEKNIKVKTVEAGQRINIENNLYFDVLWPSR